MRNHLIQNPVHLLMTLSNCKTTNRITVQIHLCNRLCMFNTDIFINRTLVDTKKKLILVDGIRQAVQTDHLIFTSLKPAGCTRYRPLHIIPLRHTARALIKGHGNGRCQIGLDLHTLFRSHKDLVAINMRVKIHTLFLDLTQLCQGKHLKSAGIGKNRSVPVHKFMKTSKLFYHLVTRTHMKMIGIG